MDTLVRVQIICNLTELRNNMPFVRAAEFGSYDADIDIMCIDTKQSRSYNCSSIGANCYGWRYFKDVWERQFGRLHP